MLSKVSGSTPNAMCRSNAFCSLKSKSEPGTEEGEARAVVHLEEGVKPTALIDLKGADQAKAKEILIENPCLLRVPATIRIMMQTFDHVILHSATSLAGG
jgi:hypothetical protein